MTHACSCGLTHRWRDLASLGTSMGLDFRDCPPCGSTMAEPLAVVSASIGRASRGWTVVASRGPAPRMVHA